MRPMKFIALLFVLMTAGGCAYQVELKNQTSQPVTLWLTKDGPPAQEGWLSPEQLAAMPPDAQPRYDLAIVPPGRTATTEKMSGEFPKGTNAVLRVYEGEKELFHIVEDAKAGKEQRVDQVLKRGMNRFTLVERDGQMVIQRTK